MNGYANFYGELLSVIFSFNYCHILFVSCFITTVFFCRLETFDDLINSSVLCFCPT